MWVVSAKWASASVQSPLVCYVEDFSGGIA